MRSKGFSKAEALARISLLMCRKWSPEPPLSRGVPATMTEIRPDLNPLRASGQARPYRGHEPGPLSTTVSDLRAISIPQTASPSYPKVFPPSPLAISTDSVTAEPVRRLAPLSISSKPRNGVRSFLDELVDERVEKSLCSIKLIPDELRDELLKRSARARR